MSTTVGGTARVRRVHSVLWAHHPSIVPKHCVCGFEVPEHETIGDHISRQIVRCLFGTLDHEDHGPAGAHEGSAERAQAHRDRHEAFCGSCLDWLDRTEQNSQT